MYERLFTPDLSGLELLFTHDFTADELKSRRQRIATQIGPDARLLITGAPPVAHDHAFQDANFYYFCGLETVHSYLLIDGDTGHTQLFLPSRTTMDGEPENKLGFEDDQLIRDRLRIDRVVSVSELTPALAGTRVLYLPHAEPEGGGATGFRAIGCAKLREEHEWDQAEPNHKRLMRLLRERVPGIELRDANPLIREMRTIKSPAEINLLRKAGKLAAWACIEAMKVTKPGVNENLLHAAGENVYRSYGNCSAAYGWIVTHGRGTWDGHSHFNNKTLKGGEVVLFDCGPDLRHYTSDIARLWPVDGVFGKWHRRVYGLIVEFHKALLAAVRPGVLPTDVYAQANAAVGKLCIEPGSPYHDVKDLYEQMVKRGVGYLNHGVGMSVHDAMGRWKDVPLREGFVVVCDPMIWCEPQHEYIRVEDTLVVTASGCERLTGDAPFEIDEIEARMK